MAIGIGSRVSWVYQGVRTYGTVVGKEGKRGTIRTANGGSVTRVGSTDDPVLRIKSESTGGPVLKKRSELRSVPKKK